METETKVLVVMDYTDGSVTAYGCPLKDGEDTDEWVEGFMAKQGHEMSDCYWMITKPELLALKF